MGINIAIDGPAGAGKSTIAKKVAKELSFIYVDTGAMYRAMALYLLEKGISGDEKISEACHDADISIRYENGEQQVILNGKNVTAFLRKEEVGNMASVSSANPEVRAHLLKLQRNLAAENNVVMDGRDIGTTILPNAEVKIFLTASAKTRASRRYLELTEKGEACDMDEILKDIVDRDERDMNARFLRLKKQRMLFLLIHLRWELTKWLRVSFRIQKKGEWMNVKVAETAGFCFGVQRAVDRVYELIGSDAAPIYTLGPIIHNEEVVSDLEKKGVAVICEKDLGSLKGGTVVIRSHGVGRRVYNTIKKYGLGYVDVTCPFVLKIHKIVERESSRGAHIVIIGDPGHPEVQGICGWCQGPYTVIKNAEDAEKFNISPEKEVCVVSQTTFNYNKFQELVEILRKKSYDNNVLNILNILNTICNATEERQKEAKAIAGEVDTMLVVGGRHSSNTQKLFEICKKECGNTYYIQTPVDLDSEMFQCSSCVGITAGASTPKKIIEEVQEHVRVKF